MIVQLAFFVASLLSVSYRKGESFGYTYSSTTVQSTADSSNDEAETTIVLEAETSFSVLGVSNQGYFIEMYVEDVSGNVTDGVDSDDVPSTDAWREYYGQPVYFTQMPDGTIVDVSVSDDDDEKTVTMKESIIFALQTPPADKPTADFEQAAVRDPQGSHYEFYKTTKSGSTTTVESHYTEEDFTEFLGEGVAAEDIALDAESKHTIVNGKVSAATGHTDLLMNRGQGSSRNDDSDEYTRLYLSASQSLSNFAQKNDIEETPEFESVEELEEKNPKYHRRHVFQQREKKVKQQPHRFKRKHPKDNTLEANLGECPSAVNLCKNYQGNWEVGNHNAGLRLIVGVVAGVSKGCSQASRSYIVGAYADINVFVVGREYGAVSAYAEYGQVSGSPLKNGIGVSLFGKSVFSKTFPYLTCQTKTYNIVDLNKDFGFTYSIVVYIVTINFSIGLSLGFTADLTYTLCVNELKANVSFIPKGEVTLRGGAEVSIVVAKAGIEISGTVSDYLDPTAYIDGNLCRVGFFMYNNLDPIQVKLQGYYQLPKLSWFKITWGDKHYLTIWQTSFSGRRDKIVDVYYGAK